MSEACGPGANLPGGARDGAGGGPGDGGSGDGAGAAGAFAALAKRAAELDLADPLRAKRTEFVLDDAEHPGPPRQGAGPPGPQQPGPGRPGAGPSRAAPAGPPVVYLDGNSLGALPAAVPARVADVVSHEWGRLRIRSWTESAWWTAPERIGDRIAPLLGAAPGQVVVGDSTSVNVLKAVVAGVRIARSGAGAARDEVLVDATTFPTDGYVAESAARLTGCTLRAVKPHEIAAAAGPRTAVALVNHVDYRTGRLHDLPGTTAALHAAGALAVWDLCHSAGALPVGLDVHGVDLAVGCTYKFLNGGPGSPAYLYVRRDLQPRFDSPLPGWNSHADPFAMSAGYRPADGAVRGRVGTPDILSMLALEAALEVWDGVAIEAVRTKSLALSDFFLQCVAALPGGPALTPLTPLPHAERGSQVALRCAGAEEVMGELIARGVVGDFRPPDVLRFGVTPLYTSFSDIYRAAGVLGEVLHDRR